MPRAVLFKSERRFDSFRRELDRRGVECTCLDFEAPEWVDFDYRSVDIVIYYPAFRFSSNHPLALSRVKDNLLHIHSVNPRARIYPDPALIPYYNDKYRQYLYLRANEFPVPDTVALDSPRAVEVAERELGFPMVLKNRFGAGGESVFLVRSPALLRAFYRLSVLDFWSLSGLKHVLGKIVRRAFYYHLVRARRLEYPFLSWPLLAQRFLVMDRDLKTVVRDGEVVEAHWRSMADSKMWKMNIDGGGVGEWSHVPRAAFEVSERLALALGARWLNIDLIPQGERFLISEFSPVWHHYRYKEKPSFVYKDDYNVPLPLQEALELETLIVESLLGDPPSRMARGPRVEARR